MRKLKLFLTAMLFCNYCFADYSGSVSTSTTEISFSTNNGYNVASFGNGFYSTKIGAPQLPVKTMSFLIPIDKAIGSINITGTSTIAIAGSYTMYPAQPRRSNDSIPFVNPDTSIYNHSTPYPSVQCQTTTDGYPYGYHVVTITFYPLQYIPSSHQIILYSNINFTIVYTSNTDNVLLPNLQNLFSNNMTKGAVQSMVVNPSDITIVSGGARQVISSSSGGGASLRGVAPVNTLLTNIPDYVIITRTDLVGDPIRGFTKLANWKIQKGINTIIVTVDGANGIYSNYQGYDNAEKIRNYLKDVYVNYGLPFVLLGGDITDSIGNSLIPARKTPIITGSCASDLYFASVQGNWNENINNVFGEDGSASEGTGYPFSNSASEMASWHDWSPVFWVGRAPSQKLRDATTFATKVIEYETLNNTSNKNYVQNIAFLANDCGTCPAEGNVGGTSVASYCDNVTTDYFSSPFNTVKLYYSTTPQLTHNNAIDVLNTGGANIGFTFGYSHLIYHMDHSGFDNLATSSAIQEGLHVADMDALTNASTSLNHYYSIFYSDGCHSNDWLYDSDSKHYINNPNGGGVAFLGNTDDGWSGDEAFFYYQQASNGFATLLYSNSTINSTYPVYDNRRYHIGYANWYAASNSAGHDGDMISRYKKRSLLGDPEMMVWTKTPQNLTVSGLSYSSSTHQITGTLSSLPTSTLVVTLTIWKANEIWQTIDYTSTSSSNYNFTFNNVVANTTGNISVTVNAHNYLPNINTISVSSISGANPYMTAQSINDNTSVDINNNNDGFPDAGEKISVPVTLTNSGSVNTSSNISATLTWAPTSYQCTILTNCSSLISLTSTVSTFPVISSGGGTQSTNTPFVFTINKDAFTPNMGYSRPLSIMLTFTLTIYDGATLVSVTPFQVEIGEPSLIKGENSVSGTLLNDGSVNQLTIKLHNTGLSQATGLSATLTSSSSNINITGSTSSYPNINGTTSATSYSTNSTPFTFKMVSSNYNATTDVFTLTVTNAHGKTWTFQNFNVAIPIASFSVNAVGDLSSINISWTCNLTPQGYNLYRSPHGAGTYSITNHDLISYNCYLDEGLSQLTIYDYKLTAIDANGNESAPYSFSASTSLAQHVGWPVLPTGSPEIIGARAEGSPNVYDLNGDGNKEIFFTSGYGNVGGVWAFNQNGSRWYSFDGDATDKNGYINYSNYTPSTPFLADINNDGVCELGVITQGGSVNSQDIFVYTNINVANTAPTQIYSASINGYDVTKGPLTADLDKDGQLEELISNMDEGASYTDGKLAIFNSNGTSYSPWSNSNSYEFGYSMPVAFDFDNDRKREIIIGCESSHSQSAGLYIFKQDGSNYASNPIFTPTSGWKCDFPPAVTDLNNDGFYEVVFFAVKNTTVNIYAYSPPVSSAGHTGGLLSGWDTSSHPSFTIMSDANVDGGGVFGSQNCPTLSVGDLNKDGYPEVVCGDNGNFYVWANTGGTTALCTYAYSFSNSPYAISYAAPIIADIDDVNTDLEVLFTAEAPSPNDQTSNLFAFKLPATGNIGVTVKGFPINVPFKVANSPCVDNIDNTGKNQVIVTTGGGFYVWDSPGDAFNNNAYGWTSYRKDNYNSGVFYDMADGFLYDEDIYIQNISGLSNLSTNSNRYFFGRNVLLGSSVTTKKTTGSVSIDNTSNIIVEASNSVLLQADITIPVGCTFEIK